jgi:type II secretory pathway component GspD/PulD (secretin)
LGECIQWLRFKGLTVVVPADNLEQLVTLSLPDPVPASVALAQLAACFESPPPVVRRADRLYYLGSADDSDLLVEVYTVPGDAGQYVDAVEALGSGDIRVQSVGDTIVVRDTMLGLDRVREMLPFVLQARGQYVVQVLFCELSDGFLADYGISVDLSGDVVIEWGLDSADPLGSSVASVASLVASAALTAEGSTHGVRLLNKSRLHVVEGQHAHLAVGEEVPVPRRAISSEGTSTVEGYDYVQAGLVVDVGVFSEPDGRLRLVVESSLSQIQGYIEGSPIRMNRSLNSSAVVEVGDSLLLGGFRSSVVRREVREFFGLPSGVSGDGSDGFVYVVVSVFDPVSGGVIGLPGIVSQGPVSSDQNTGAFETNEAGFIGPIGAVE